MICRAREQDEAFDLMGSNLAPVLNESVCDWVEANVELTSGAITGKAQLRKTPYLREILEHYGNRETRHLVMVFPTQSGKTFCLIAGMLYRIARLPEDALWVMGSTKQARGFNKERFMPSVRACQPVLDLCPRTAKGVIDKHLWGVQDQHYRSMVVNFVGAGSATDLSSRPRGFLQMDETDKYYEQIKFDAGTIQLAEDRQKSFHFPCSVKASSPTTVDRMIYQEYLKTDQRQFWLPCPRCERRILLKFKEKVDKLGDCGLRWWHENESEAKTDGEWDMKKILANAFYRCQGCGGMIHDFEREDMLQEGIWIPQALRAPVGRHGFNINSLYSILGRETSLGSIAVKFMIAKGLRSDLQIFVNGWLAEPWDEAQAYEFKDVPLEIFTPQQIPLDNSTSLMAIDVQELGYWVLVRRFQKPTPAFPNGQSWLVYAGYVDTEEALEELQKEYLVENENVTMDMAGRPNTVAKMIIKHNWRGVWGSDTKKFYHPGPNGTKVTRPYSVTQWRDPMLGTAWENRTFKRAAYVLFSKSEALDMVASLRHCKTPIWHCTINAHPKYSAHLNSRVKQWQKNKRTGRVEFVWHELTQANHLADCENHVTIRALMLGLLILPNETDAANVK